MSAVVKAPFQVTLPPKLIPVFSGAARYRMARGGRGSGKTRSFAKMAALAAARYAIAGRKGIILCCREFMNSLDDSSLAEVKAAIASDPVLSACFTVTKNTVTTNDGNVEFVFAGLRHNLDSVKSKALILLCWIDEAEPVSAAAWEKLVPTVRESGSEIWVTWNPERAKSPTNLRFGGNLDPDMKRVDMNWKDNPFFPAVLEIERQRDLRERPEQYDHIWEGGFKTVSTGAYYAAALTEAKLARRICRLSRDPLMAIRSYHDIGGAGAKADAYSIIICQFVDREIRILDHYTSIGQSLDYHVGWMREHGYQKAEIILPHDGINANNVSGKTYEEHWRDAGFSARTYPPQGAGAEMLRVENARRWFPRMWFDVDLTMALRESLGWYHPKIDEKRKIDMGPDHDWSSHDADAFGLMASDYKEPSGMASLNIKMPRAGVA